jgi:hypothetical protein
MNIWGRERRKKLSVGRRCLSAARTNVMNGNRIRRNEDRAVKVAKGIILIGRMKWVMEESKKD